MSGRMPVYRVMDRHRVVAYSRAGSPGEACAKVSRVVQRPAGSLAAVEAAHDELEGLTDLLDPDAGMMGVVIPPC